DRQHPVRVVDGDVFVLPVAVDLVVVSALPAQLRKPLKAAARAHVRQSLPKRAHAQESPIGTGSVEQQIDEQAELRMYERRAADDFPQARRLAWVRWVASDRVSMRVARKVREHA